MNEQITLDKAQVGDRFKFSPRGCTWVVVVKTEGHVLNSVIQIQNKNKTVRTYCNRDAKWNCPIIYV